MTHPMAIVGLILNMAGSLMLLWYPPKVTDYTPDGAAVSAGGTFSELPATLYGKQQYQLRRRGFNLAIALLVLGFLLQLLDLLRP